MEREEIIPDRIYTITDFLSREECQHFIGVSEGEGYDAATITTAQGAIYRPDIRNNDRVIHDDFVLAANLWSRVAPFVPSPFIGRVAIGLNERFRFYRYDVGQTFAPHYDGRFRRDNGEESQVTFMVYLNDDFLGGETRFELPLPYGNLNIVPKQGMALLFYHRMLHEGAPVLQGRKYVLRTDVMYDLPKSA